MATVDWNTKEIVQELVRENWNKETEVDVELKSEGDTGGVKVTSISNPIVEIEEQDTRGMNRADITYSSFDKSSTIYVTIRAPNEAVQPYWVEVLRILLNHRTREKGLPGNWDYITVDDLSVENPTFNEHTATIRVQFEANSQVYNGNVGE